MFYENVDYTSNSEHPALFDSQGNMIDVAGSVIVPRQAIEQYRSYMAPQSFRPRSSFGEQTSPSRREVDANAIVTGAHLQFSRGGGTSRPLARIRSQPNLATTHSHFITGDSSNFLHYSSSTSHSESSFDSPLPAQLAHDHGLGGLANPRATYISAPPRSNASFPDDADTSTGASGWQTSGLGLHQNSTLPADPRWLQTGPEQSDVYSQPPSITFSAPQDATSLPPQTPSYIAYPPPHLSLQTSYMPPDRENMQTPVSPVSAHNSPNDTTADQQQHLMSRKRSHSVMSQQDAVMLNAVNNSRAASVGSQNAQSPGEEYSPRGSRAFKRGDPPTSGGKYICDFSEECAGQTFDRKCEWSKHMDKHDRPYRCPHPSCAKLQGFTYSGGLLRHEREVHGKHGGPKAQLMCPHPECKRNTGKGFTRKENLNEHLRRVHAAKDLNSQDATGTRDTNDILPGTDEAATPASMGGVDTTDPALTSPDHKRKRSMPPVDHTIYEDTEGLKLEVKRLRAEADAKDLRIRDLEIALSHAQQFQVSHQPTVAQE